MKKSLHSHAFAIVALVACSTLHSLVAAADPQEDRLTEIIGKMTLEEKVAMCVGAGPSSFKGVPRLEIPDMVCTDGPRGPHINRAPYTTAFPAGIVFGASWNPVIMREAAAAMAKETRGIGATMLLGPGINILRDPLGGRFFEYFTEDPLLNARLTVAYVEGVQSQNVAACIKHFAANNREENRNLYMSMVSERTLNEIYFPAFKAGVQQGHAWSLMTAANGVNGDLSSDSKFLLQDTLKDQWGFDGMVLTDWCQTRTTEKAALAGLDVSMPFNEKSLFGQPLLEAVKAGTISNATLDDKVRRVLRTFGRVGLLDKVPPKQGAENTNPEHHDISRRAAAEGLVLLKNDGNLLPLDKTATRKLLVVGQNADQRFCVVGLGGSSWQESPYEVTALQGIRNAVGKDTKVQFFSTDDLGGFEVIPAENVRQEDGSNGFLAKYYQTGNPQPVVQRTEKSVEFLWEMRSPEPEKIAPEKFRAQFFGRLMPPVTGTYTLRITSGGGSAAVYENPVGGAPLAVADAGKGLPAATATLQMEAGKTYLVRVDYTKVSGDAACRLEWAMPTDEKKMADAYARLETAAKSADAVLVFAGIDHSLDSEGRDRTDMKFPESQVALINHVVAANPKTVVTLINGSPLELGEWLPKVPAVIEAWYGGMEAGNVIADIIFGDVNPSGRLPFSWPKVLADSPSHAIGKQSVARIDYLEGIFIGYRYFDSKKVEPEFPFGFGLSYTGFAFSKLEAKADGDQVAVSFTVKNTGKVAGAETAQLYVAPPAGPVERAVHELKGFEKVSLKPGEEKRVELQLNRDAFAYYDETKKSWEVPAGDYQIQVGSNSRDLPLTATVKR